MPELNDVNTTPVIAIHSVSAKATIRKPAHCNISAKKILTLNKISKWKRKKQNKFHDSKCFDTE